jgi:hypothetical protein
VSHPRTMASWLQYDWSTFDRLATAAPSLRSYNTQPDIPGSMARIQ